MVQVEFDYNGLSYGAQSIYFINYGNYLNAGQSEIDNAWKYFFFNSKTGTSLMLFGGLTIRREELKTELWNDR